jgi:hypothetical protein
MPQGHAAATINPPGTLSSLPSPSRPRHAIGTGVASEDRAKRVLHDDVDGGQVQEVLGSPQAFVSLVADGGISSHPQNCDAEAEDLGSGLAGGIDPTLVPVPPVTSARPAAVWTWGLSGIRKRKKVD